MTSDAVRVPLRLRILALLVDYLVILAWMAVLAAITAVITQVTGDVPDWLALGPGRAQLLGAAVLTLPVAAYLWLTESSTRRASVGKRALRLRVTAPRPARRQILLRTAVKLVPWELAHFFIWRVVDATADGSTDVPGWISAGLWATIALPIAYVIMVAVRRDGRGPHDLVAGTRVVLAP